MRGYVGLIAEDISDIDSIKNLIYSITNKNVGCKHFIGEGCGKIARKCNAWAKQLLIRGCSVLILVHDADTSDSKEISELYKSIENALSPSPIGTHLISIPIQELEAWFLSDPSAIKTALNLRIEPKVKGIIEFIQDPKEHLGEIVTKASKGEKTYVNTVHNKRIAKIMDINKTLKKCPSFKPFHDFVKLHI